MILVYDRPRTNTYISNIKYRYYYFLENLYDFFCRTYYQLNRHTPKIRIYYHEQEKTTSGTKLVHNCKNYFSLKKLLMLGLLPSFFFFFKLSSFGFRFLLLVLVSVELINNIGLFISIDNFFASW